jgi:hypothetical protein
MHLLVRPCLKVFKDLNACGGMNLCMFKCVFWCLWGWRVQEPCGKGIMAGAGLAGEKGLTGDWAAEVEGAV